MHNIVETKELLAKIENKCILQDIGLLAEPFPLHYISLCHEVMWREVDEWNDKEMAKINKDKACAMVEFWREYYVVRDFVSIDYRKYYEDFYCADPDETDEDILWAPKSKFIEAGSREIDVDLYCAVCRFDFERTHQLLDMGANPNIDLYEKPESELEEWEKHDGCHALNKIGAEESYLIHETLWLLQEAKTDMVKRGWIDRGTISNILGIAAYSEMYRLLDMYVEKLPIDSN